MLFSEDTLEKDGSILEKDEKQGPTSVTQFYVPSIEKIETLEAEDILSHVKFGRRIRYYRFNEASQRAEVVWNLIEVF